MTSRVCPLLLLLVCSLAVAKAQLKVFNLRATDLPADIFGVTDGYVKVSCMSAILGQTEVRHNSANPWWDEQFFYYEAQENDILRLELHDEDVIFDDLLGACQINIKPGTHEHNCYLEKGVLYYSYTFTPQQ